ncbi:MAG: M1 family aminopeptidase [Kofleriaceae bacterium]
MLRASSCLAWIALAACPRRDPPAPASPQDGAPAARGATAATTDGTAATTDATTDRTAASTSAATNAATSAATADAQGASNASTPSASSRLPATARPIAYDVWLDLDPARDAFSGRVAIDVALDAPADHVWLHADQLAITSARFRAAGQEGALERTSGTSQRIRLGFGRTLPAGPVTLELAYTGETTGTEEGLFRQEVDGAPFLYAQSESMFARRIVPCFDEPRFKARWQVAIAAPADQIALANAPVASARALPDGRRETRFAPIGPLSPHVFSVAVGPFVLVDAGRVGRHRVPVRIAVARSQRGQTAAIAPWAARLVDALERYLDQPLPWPKLDLVAVPQLFGAMENPGLITFDADTLLGDPRDPVYLRRFVRFLAHELAHQWFGNAVTPAWWDDLWLSEAFATWLDDKLAAELGGLEDGALRHQLARALALDADRAVGARPVRRTVVSPDDAEDAFDAISYEKGAAVLAMFEQFAGADRFRAAVRGYLRDRANATATTPDFLAALARETSPELARAFAGYLDRPGVPVVEVELRCDDPSAPPVVAIGPRDRDALPVCVRYPARRGPATTCTLASAGTTVALADAAGCPAWLVGNAEGRGYFEVRGPAATRAPQLARIATPAERLAAGQDLVGAIARGELRAPDALAEIATRAGSRDPYDQLAGLAIARALDPLVPEAVAPRWSAWLAARFGALVAAQLARPERSAIDRALHEALWDVLPVARDASLDRTDRVATPPLDRARRAAAQQLDRARRAAAQQIERALARRTAPPEPLALAVALAGPAGAAWFDRITAAALATSDAAHRERWLVGLAVADPALAPRLVALVLDRGDRIDPDEVWPVVAPLFERAASRPAAWRAVRDALPRILDPLTPTERAELVDATGALCEPAERAEVAAAFAPRLAEIRDGERRLARALASIDRCIAQRGALGDLAAALR